MSGRHSVDSTLEIGAGNGLFSATLFETGVTTEATALDPVDDGEDITQDGYDHTGANLEELYPNQLRFVEGWFPQDIPEEEYDIIAFRRLLHHIYRADTSTHDEVVQGLEKPRDNMTDRALCT